MNSNALMPVVLALLAGAGGVFARVLMTDSDQTSNETPDSSVQRTNAGPDMSAFEALRKEVHALREQVADLKRGRNPVATSSLSEKRTRDDLDNVKDQIEELKNQDRSDIIAEQVEAVTRKREQEAAEAKRQNALRRARARAQQRAQDVAQKLSLSPDQTDRLCESLEATYGTNGPHWGTVKNGASTPEARLTALTALRESLTQFHQSLPNFLTPSQVEQYPHDKGTDPRTLTHVEGLITELQNTDR